MSDIDPHAKDRATKLIKDARKGTWGNVTHRAFSSIKNAAASAGRSVAGWQEDTGIKQTAIESTLRISVAAGSTAAGVALASLAVGWGVATFGIAPALVVVTGAIVKFGIGEFKYQRGSNQLIRATKHGQSFGVDLLVPAMHKVLRKYDWVKVRNYQVQTIRNFKDFRKRVSNVVMSPRFAARGRFWKHKAYVHKLVQKDEELDKRCLELQYYAQMSMNALGEVLDACCIARDQYAEVLSTLYRYTIRQVHWTGNHEHCGNHCYGKPEAEVLAAIKANPASREMSQTEIDAFDRDQKMKSHATRSNSSASTILRTLEQIAHPGSAGDGAEASDMGQEALSMSANILKSSQTSKIAELELGGAVELAGGESQTLFAENIAGQAVEIAGKSASTGAAALAGATSEAGTILLEGIGQRYNNYMARRAFLKTKESALSLAELSNEGEEEGKQELYSELITKKNQFRKQIVRCAQKVVHYVGKMKATDEKCKEILTTMQGWTKGGPSPFRSCAEAWEYNRAMSYAFKNYNKFLTHVVYMATLLEQLDVKVSSRVAELKPGDIVTIDRHVEKPQHMKDRQGDDFEGWTENPMNERPSGE